MGNLLFGFLFQYRGRQVGRIARIVQLVFRLIIQCQLVELLGQPGVTERYRRIVAARDGAEQFGLEVKGAAERVVHRQIECRFT